MRHNGEVSPKGEIVLYQNKDNKIQLEVKLEQETVWLSQRQIAALFKTDRTVITKHLRNIFKSKELCKNSVCAKIAHTASDGKTYQSIFYNLDAVISVGYRVNSTRATQFRIWATSVLKRHLIEGYTLNEKRLREQENKLRALQKAIKLIGSIKDKKQLEYKEALGLIEVINDYSYALSLLDDYDNKKLKISQISKEEKFKLTYDAAVEAVYQIRNRLGYSDLFGREKDQSFKSSLAAIYQTFGSKDLYPSVEEKAANLLYFIIKNHSFIDGNKRIAASMFLWFLEKNSILYKEDGSKRIADNALVALTLMIAESAPIDREIILTLVVNLINRNN
ncbi:MAG: virulence RhuM family protein [Candidatus Omnitrophica bacterium]|nr:virulence RhuM family protein [Candidatus Omnitrophota bacterium]MBU4488482.1 virulence RhuM family protein [Candidatus Omnitrophota bacterium]MCG2704606.1 virulence RhuM family protein [Candidatus Omnitrophota bacterium]